MSGSLDHVFANAGAKAMVTGVDVWEINANESVFYQYSRFNYIGTDLYQPSVFASSDHNPEVVGIKLPAVDPGTPDVSIKAKVTPRRVIVDRTRARAHIKIRGKDKHGSGRRNGGGARGIDSCSRPRAVKKSGVVNLKLPSSRPSASTR